MNLATFSCNIWIKKSSSSIWNPVIQENRQFVGVTIYEFSRETLPDTERTLEGASRVFVILRFERYSWGRSSCGSHRGTTAFRWVCAQGWRPTKWDTTLWTVWSSSMALGVHFTFNIVNVLYLILGWIVLSKGLKNVYELKNQRANSFEGRVSNWNRKLSQRGKETFPGVEEG